MAVSTIANPKDLKKLPLRALVAYASRCARRVQSLYCVPDGRADAETCREAIEAGIRLAEFFASGEHFDDDVSAEVEEGVVQAILAVSGDGDANQIAALAANTAYAAICATTAALQAAGGSDDSEASERVCDAAATAYDAAIAIREDVARAADFDWEMLNRLHLGKFPQLGDPVNPTEGGILGPFFCRAGSPPSKRKSTESSPHAATPARPVPEEDRQGVERPISHNDVDISTDVLRDTVEKLRVKQDELTSRAAELEEQHHAIDADRAALNAVNDQLEQRRHALDQEAALLEQERREVVDARDAATVELAERRETIGAQQRALEADRMALAAQRDQLQSQIEQFRVDREILEGEAERLRRQLEANTQLESEIVHRRESLDAENTKLGAAKDELQSARAEFEKRVAEIGDRERRLEEQEIRLDEQKTALTASAQAHQAADANRHKESQRHHKSESEIARKRRSLDEDSTRLGLERNALGAERTRLEELAAALDDRERSLREQQSRFDEEATALAVQTHALRTENEKVHKSSEGLQQREADCCRRDAELRAYSSALRTEEQQLQEQRQILQAELEQVRRDAEAAVALQTEIEQRERDVEQRAREIEQQRIAVEARAAEQGRRQIKVDAAARDLGVRQKGFVEKTETEEKRWQELGVRIESDQQALKVSRLEVKAARLELRRHCEEFDAARIAFLEEKAAVSKKEADIHAALKQLREERTRLIPEGDALQSLRLQQTPSETVADIQLVLSRLHEERQRLKVEREQLAEIFTLVSSGRRSGSLNVATKFQGAALPSNIDGSRLRILLDPGSASADQIAALLAELSTLDQRLGGPGVAFLVNDCRIWNHALLKARLAETLGSKIGDGPQVDLRQAAGTERSLVEIYAVPTSSLPPEAAGASHWDRFAASLFMVLRLDAGQANYFDLSDVASTEHPIRRLAALAMEFAEGRRPEQEPERSMGDSATTAIDRVNQQLQVIEGLRRTLEREESMILELAPAVEPRGTIAAPAHSDQPGSASRDWSRSAKLALTALFTAALTGAAWFFVR